MTELLGVTVDDALAVLGSYNGVKPVNVIETSGYKASQDMTAYTDVRVVGIRETELEILLIIAKF